MKKKNEEEKKCFIITGGETFNKGAQAMTFVTIDNIRKMFKNSEIVLLSGREYNKKEEDEKIYKFKLEVCIILLKIFLNKVILQTIKILFENNCQRFYGQNSKNPPKFKILKIIWILKELILIEII